MRGALEKSRGQSGAFEAEMEWYFLEEKEIGGMGISQNHSNRTSSHRFH